MTDTTLSREQTLALLRRLASDDDFRARFETKPAKALIEIGLKPEEIIELAGACLAPCKLASREEFAETIKQADEDFLTRAAAMRPPKLRLQA